MSWGHETIGWSTYDAFIEELRRKGVKLYDHLRNENQPKGKRLCRGGDLGNDVTQPLRMARFLHGSGSSGKWLVVEEILSVDDKGCDGLSIVSILVYPDGERPSTEKLTVVAPA